MPIRSPRNIFHCCCLSQSRIEHFPRREYLLLISSFSHDNDILKIRTGRDSSVGRASDRRSEGPRFDPGSRHSFFLLLLSKAPCGDRTHDHTLTKRMLCQLSYRGDVRMSKRKLCKLSISPCNTSRRNAESTSPPQRISCLLLSRRVSIFVASHRIAEGCLPCMGMLLVIRYDGRTGIYASGQHRRSK